MCDKSSRAFLYAVAARAVGRGSNVCAIEFAPPGVEAPLFRGDFAEEMKNEKGMDVAVLVNRAIAAIEAGRLEITPEPSMASRS